MEVNDIFREFAEAFVGRIKGEGDIALPAKLRRKVLDYSLESLVSVDGYLRQVYKHRNQIPPVELDNTLLWCGAYVGEVIRRIAKKTYQWVEYEDFIAKNPKLSEIIPNTYGTRAVLMASDGSATFPVNKIVRFMEEGPANGVHFYASGER